VIANVIDDVSARFGNLLKTGACLYSCFDSYDHRRLHCGLLLLCHDLVPRRGPGPDVAALSTCCALSSCHSCLLTVISSDDHLRVCGGVLGLCHPRSVALVWRLFRWSWAVHLSVHLYVSHVLQEARP